MNGSDLYEALKQVVPEQNLKMNVPLKQYTTFRTGGAADCFVEITDPGELAAATDFLRNSGIPYFVMGNGSNLLVSDQGYRGVILHIEKGMSAIRTEGDRMKVQAGALMSVTSKKALECGLTGLEFASGIPGTVGGGAVMNAGAYGGEFGQVAENVTVLDPDGEKKILDRDSMEFGYRTSAVRNRGYIVTEVCFRLKPGNPEEIRERMAELAKKRKEKQPLEYFSAGSTFKRPVGNYAGKLIMEAGLRGFALGGAQVSEKHCGFIINKGNATAADIHKLIGTVSDRVYENSGIRLEPEVIELGEF